MFPSSTKEQDLVHVSRWTKAYYASMPTIVSRCFCLRTGLRADVEGASKLPLTRILGNCDVLCDITPACQPLQVPANARNSTSLDRARIGRNRRRYCTLRSLLLTLHRPA